MQVYIVYFKDVSLQYKDVSLHLFSKISTLLVKVSGQLVNVYYGWCSYSKDVCDLLDDVLNSDWQIFLSYMYTKLWLAHISRITSMPNSDWLIIVGGTEEYGAMVDEVLRRHPDTRLMGLGFSMGANVVVKYVGEDISRQEKFLCLMSLCQGYDAEK